MNGCNNWHPHKAISCVRGVHSFKTPCVARHQDEMLATEWTGQTVFLITNGGWPVGMRSSKIEAEKIVNAKNLEAKNAGEHDGFWRIHPFVLDAEIIKLLSMHETPMDAAMRQRIIAETMDSDEASANMGQRTLESDLREDR